MQEEYIPHYEIYHNRRWSLLEAERIPDHSIVLLLVYSQREMQHVGLANIKKKYEKFHKVQQALGDKVLHANITSYNKNIALVFDFPQKHRIADSFVPLSQCTPISSIHEYLDVAINLLQYIFVIHKNNCLHNCVNINAFVTHVGDQSNVQLLDMGDMMDVNSIASGQGHTSTVFPGTEGTVVVDKDDTSSEDNATNAGRLNKEYLEELVDYRYASPEHTGRIESTIDRRSDIYSLGVLLYELAVGKVPFDSSDVLEVLHSHMTQSPPELPSHVWATRSDVRAKVNAIILKMMNKSPQGRYQSLYGVIRDLEYLREAVKVQSEVTDLVIGAHDLEDEFLLGRAGSSMYGRESQKQQVEQFLLEFKDENKASLISIKGHSGVGKSTLVKYIFERLHQKRDSGIVMLSGKHDRLKQTPYSVLVELVGDLVRRLLALSADELATWSTNLNEALAPNGQVLIEFIPEIAGVIGPQPPVPNLPSFETRQRFETVFIAFCQVFFATYTVVLFFDDVQWADYATVSLIETLLTNNSIRNFMVIMAYRGTEVNPGSPLKLLLDNLLSREQMHSLAIELGDLELSDVEGIVNDCFRCKSHEKARLLANLLFQKTRGNPFFLCQLLRSIANDNHVVYNYKIHEWEWSIDQLSTVQFTENVIDFLVEQIKKLPKDAQIVAQTGACFGNKFEASDLIELTNEDVVSNNLPLLIATGFVNPEEDPTQLTSRETIFRFVHDRIQEAFYSLMNQEERKQAHLKIARMKKERYEVDSQDMLFTVAHHYNAASDLILRLPDDSEERRQVMIINMEAAARAKRSSAIEAACVYLHFAQKAMSSKLLTTDYPTWFSLHHFLAECEAICGKVWEADKLFDILLRNATSDRDKVRVYILKINAHFVAGNLTTSVEAAKAALLLNNIELPTPTDEVLEQMVNDVIAAQREKTGDNILDLVRIFDADEDYQLAIEALHITIPVAFTLVSTTNMNFFYAIMAVMCKISIMKGMTVYSANGLACFSSYLTGLKKTESYEYGLLAMKLQDKRPHPATVPRTKVNFMGFAQWQRESPQACRATILSAYKSGVEVGDSLYALYAALIYSSCCFMLDHVEDGEPQYFQMLTTLRGAKSLNPSFVDSVFAIYRTLGLLKGGTIVDGEFDDFDPLDYYETLSKMNAYFFVAYPFYGIITMYTIIEEYDKAFELDAKMPLHCLGNALLYFDYLSWSVLLHLAVLPTNSASKPESKTHFEIASKRFLELDFVADSPFLSAQVLLCGAELARVKGDYIKATVLYAQAIEKAKAIPSQRLIGFACEKAMNFYLHQKKEKQAKLHFREARAAYFAWGAYIKTRQLENKFNPIVGHGRYALHSGAQPTPTPASPHDTHQSRTIDITSVLQACQVMSGEMDFSKLLFNMVRILIQNTGAQRGFFIIPDETGKLFVEVQGDANGNFQFSHVEINSISSALSPPSSPRIGSVKSSPITYGSPPPPFSPIKSTEGSEASPQLLDKDKDSKKEEKNRERKDSLKKSREVHNDIGSPTPSAASPNTLLPVGIVHYVYKTKAPVLLTDAAQEGIFSFEPHVQANNTKSVLCVPALYQSHVVAILYVENNLMSGAFTAERLEVAQMISTQIGISFVNAKLYTDLQSANKLLAQKNKALIEYDQIKDQFLANTSHELRTPLNGIIGLAESLLESGTDPANASSTLSIIINCGKRLANLVNDILDYNSLRVGTFNFNPRPTDLTKNVAEIVSVSLPLIGSKQITLINHVKKLPIIRVDPSRIQQVLQNIIGNAIKFTDQGQIVIESKVTDDWVTISVSDTGCGIPESQFSLVFEEFKQVDGSISREVGGTGLGLPISKKIIELHRGSINFESEIGKGSVFHISLPNTSSDSPPATLRSTPIPPARYALTSSTPPSPSTPRKSSPLAISPRAYSSPLSHSQTITAPAPSTPASTSNTATSPIPAATTTSATQTLTPPTNAPKPGASSTIPPLSTTIAIPALSPPPSTTPAVPSTPQPTSTTSISTTNQPTSPPPVSTSSSTTSTASPVPTDGPIALTHEDGTPEFTVLSVDDDNSNQIVIKKLLGKKFSIVTAMSGQEALNKVNEGLIPDFILLDVMMPKMSGLEVLEILRRRFPIYQLPIIMVSAKNKPADVVAGLSKGANDYVGKPINKDELIARMTAQLTICLFCKTSSQSTTTSCANCKKRGKEIQEFGHFLFAPRYLINILDLLPFAITVYDADANVVLRNKFAADVYDSIRGVADNRVTFLPHAKIRDQANTVFASVKRSLNVDEIFPVVYNGKDLKHKISARLFVVTKEGNTKVPFILVTEQPITEPSQPRRHSVSELTLKDAMNGKHSKREFSTQTSPTIAQPTFQTPSTSTTTTTSTTTATPAPTIATTNKPKTTLNLPPRATSPRASPNPPPLSSPRRASPARAAVPATPSRSSTPPRSTTPPRATVPHANILTSSTSSPLSSSSSLGDSQSILSVDQLLDYVDTLHDYIGDLEKEKRGKGEIVPHMIRSSSLPTKFKNGSRPSLRPPVPKLSIANPTQPTFTQQTVRTPTTDTPTPYIIPQSTSTGSLIPTPFPSPRPDDHSLGSSTPLSSSEDIPISHPYFTRSSFNTPAGTPLNSSRSTPSDAPYFTLSSFPSLESIPESLLPYPSRTLYASSTIARTPQDSLSPRSSQSSARPYSFSSPRGSLPPLTLTSNSSDARVIRREIHDLQAQIYFRQAQLDAYIHVKFRVAQQQNTNSRFKNALLATFYSALELCEPSHRLLCSEIARRLEISAHDILAIVKNNDTLVSVDEDIDDGMAVDVYLGE